MSPERLLRLTRFALAFSAAWSGQALADDYITCESKNSRYQTCPLPNAGYVSLERQLSGADCRQGRTWDYDRREIWVDDGCRAEFRVHAGSAGHRGDSDAKDAAGLLIGAVILGAIAANAHKNDSKYDDANYQGARHTSYVPGWMVGTFEGYNSLYDADVTLTIESDGRATALAKGQTVHGWINDGQLNISDTAFDIDQSREGLVTSQVGDRQNEVRYRRVR